jgi:hypothetical protein
VHRALGRLYVAHTANDALDVLDSINDRYLHSILELTGVAGALVSDEQNLIFTSNRGENTAGIFAPDDEAGLVRISVVSAQTDLLTTRRTICSWWLMLAPRICRTRSRSLL